jgi:metallophosphoesterase superfamily enzyme
VPPKPLQWSEGSWIVAPFRFIHDADRAGAVDAHDLFVLSGHVHPVARLRSGKKGALRVPVFWQKTNGLVLPSFGLFTGGFAVSPARGDRLYAAGPDGVIALG